MYQSIKPVKLRIPNTMEGSEKVLLPVFTKRKSIGEDVNNILEMTVDQHEGDGIKREGFSSLCPIKTGIWGPTWGAVLWSAFHNDNKHDGDQPDQCGAAGHWFCTRSLTSRIYCVSLERWDQSHTVWFLCIFTEQLQDAWSIGTSIGPRAKVPLG